MNEIQFKEVNRKLDMLIKLLATQIIHDKEYRYQVMLLNKLGFQPREMADITGKSANNINVTLHLIKKESLKKGGKQNGK